MSQGTGPRLDGESVYKALEEFKCDSTAAVPTVFLNLLDYMAAENKQLHHMKMMRVGGAACPAKIVTKFSRYIICIVHCLAVCLVMQHACPPKTVTTFSRYMPCSHIRKP